VSNVIVGKLYGNMDGVEERHRHRYEVNPAYINDFENAGMVFVGMSHLSLLCYR